MLGSDLAIDGEPKNIADDRRLFCLLSGNGVWLGENSSSFELSSFKSLMEDRKSARSL